MMSLDIRIENTKNHSHLGTILAPGGDYDESHTTPQLMAYLIRLAIYENEYSTSSAVTTNDDGAAHPNDNVAFQGKKRKHDSDEKHERSDENDDDSDEENNDSPFADAPVEIDPNFAVRPENKHKTKKTASVRLRSYTKEKKERNRTLKRLEFDKFWERKSVVARRIS